MIYERRIKMFKKIRKGVLFTFITLFLLVSITGCNNKEDDKKEDDKKEETKKQYGFNDTFKYEGLEITVGDTYSFDKVQNEYSDLNGKDLIKLPITVKNVSEETNSLTTSQINQFGPNGTEVDSLFIGDDDDISKASDLRPDASYTKYYYILYDGDGEYVLEFDNWPNRSIEVKIKIDK